MVINIDTQNIDQYPGIIKRVSVDQEKIVPMGFEGDEQFVITVGTSAYSDNVSRTQIQDLYITDFVSGWCKSSGFKGVGGKFALDSSHNELKVRLDSTVSGSDGSGYYTISLAHSNGVAIPGEVIAEDMESKLRNVECVTADAGHQLAYKNSVVEFKNGKFWIVSGSIGRYYTGPYRSSVSVAAADSNDCSSILGFDINMTSEGLANNTVAQALLTQDYTADTNTLYISAGAGVEAGNCIMIKDSNGNKEYVSVLAVSGTELTIPTNSSNGYIGITNNYLVADSSYIQVLKEQDPDAQPTPWFDNVDSLIRYGVSSIINQIDYSS